LKRKLKLSKLSKRDVIYGYLLISPWLIGFLVFTLIPMIASLYLSFTNYELFKQTQWTGPSNYIRLSRDKLVGIALYNTAYYVFIGVPLRLIFALLLAVLLNQKIKGTTIFRALFYLPSVTSSVAMALLWLWLFNPDFGLINYILSLLGIKGPGWLVDAGWSKPALIIMSLWGVGPTMMIFLAGLQGIPESLYEAAILDGATNFRKFISITLPLLSPVMLFNLIIQIIQSFQVFTSAYVMTGGGPVNSTLFYVLYLFRIAFQFLEMGYGSALAWVLFAIILVFTVIQMKLSSYWVYYEGGI
jgi:multiple sugar transport system permease protein